MSYEIGEYLRNDGNGEPHVATVYADPDSDYPCDAHIPVSEDLVAVGYGDSPDEAADHAIVEYNAMALPPSAGFGDGGIEDLLLHDYWMGLPVITARDYLAASA